AEGPVRQPSVERTTTVYALLDTLVREWRKQPTIEGRTFWGWKDWITLVLVSSTALGLVRFMVGLWAMRRLRLRALPLNDPTLTDALDILRAEMRCVRPVETRVSAELATPATIGWKRVLVLLPQDWQTWDDAERRAVLAHELAHVCRDDFLTGLLAQLSLA